MTRVYISVGSNVDREAQVPAALRILEERFGPLIVSPVYESRAVGFEGDPFFNLVVGLDTELSPQDLVARLKSIERERGRGAESNGFRPRTLDLDLLLYDELILEQDGIELPRPEILEHAFVLAPLADIAPDLRHPVLGRTVAQLWREFEMDGRSLRRVDLA